MMILIPGKVGEYSNDILITGKAEGYCVDVFDNQQGQRLITVMMIKMMIVFMNMVMVMVFILMAYLSFIPACASPITSMPLFLSADLGCLHRYG